MNYHEYGKFVLQVKVTLKPLWTVPPSNIAEEMGRNQSEDRMAMMGDQLARFIGEALMSKQTPEEWAEVSHRLRIALSER